MTTPPNERTAREVGCTCRWWGGGSIVEFDRACPILHLHIVPDEANWLLVAKESHSDA